MADPHHHVGFSSILFETPTKSTEPAYDLELDQFLSRQFPFVEEQQPGVQRMLCNLSNLEGHVGEQLELISRSQLEENEVTGRIGPSVVHLDESSSSSGGLQRYKMNESKTFLESNSNFTSMRANVAVSTGKWMYEVLLGSAGIQQIGWCTINSKFTNEEGVGDSPDSYGFDGKRRKLWNMEPKKYGEIWTPGDVIGCLLDLDEGCVSFTRNGVDMGVACDKVRIGAGYAYFPSISLSYCERSQLNFGASPLLYPVEGYTPLQAEPTKMIAQTKYLLESHRRLLNLEDGSAESFPAVLETRRNLVLFLCGAQSMRPFNAFIDNDYIIAAELLPYLRNLYELSGEETEGPFAMTLNTLIISLTPEALKTFMETAMYHIGAKCQTSPTWDAGTHVAFAVALLSHRPLLISWLQSPGYKKQLEHLFTTKLIGVQDLNRIIPDAWWEGAPENIKEEPFKARCTELETNAVQPSLAHVRLIFLFINDVQPADGSHRPESIHALNWLAGTVRSPREHFQHWLDDLVKRNAVLRRQVVPPGTSDPTVLYNVFYAVTEVLRQRQQGRTTEAWIKDNVPDSIFTHETLLHHGLPHLGGTFSHLTNELRESVKKGDIPEPPKEVDITLDMALFDRSAMLFSLALVTPLRRLKAASNDLFHAIKAVQKGQENLAKCDPSHTAGREILEESLRVFIDQALECTRTTVVYRITFANPHRREDLRWWLDTSLALLTGHYKGAYFGFVPECYVETAMACYSTLSTRLTWSNNKKSQLLSEPSGPAQLLHYTSFLVSLIGDERIATPDLSVSVMVGVRSIMGAAEHVRVLEQHPQFRRDLVEGMIKSFGSRYWVPSSDILLRFWNRQGFAAEACRIATIDEEPVDPDCASVQFCETFREVCVANPDLVSKFINEMLNSVNWAITEFDQVAQEIAGAADSGALSNESNERYRRCSLMCELAVNLLRILEATVGEISFVYHGTSDSEMNLSRVVEVVIHVFKRMTSSTRYGDVLDSSAMQSVKRVLLLSPILGTLMGLINMESKHPGAKEVVLKAIFEQLGSNPAPIDYLQEDCVGFANTIGVTDEDVAQLQSFLALLKSEQQIFREKETMQEEDDEGEDDGNICTICYASPMIATFLPCKHQSCKRCIVRHMLNDDKCFFCKMKIEDVSYDEDVPMT